MSKLRVKFETYEPFVAYDEFYHPVAEHQNIKRVEGEVVDTLMIPFGDSSKPCFIVALDDLSFTYVPIDECERVSYL